VCARTLQIGYANAWMLKEKTVGVPKPEVVLCLTGNNQKKLILLQMIRSTMHNPFLLAEQTRFLCFKRVEHAQTQGLFYRTFVIRKVSPRKWFGRATWAGTALAIKTMPEWPNSR
jgi:hypothetical protein